MTDIKNIKFYDDNVLNIDTERLFREAEDSFYFLGKTEDAICKLQSGLKLSPHHTKSLKFLGDIYYTEGKMENALDCYSVAGALKPNDAHILSSIASTYDAIGDYSKALAFINLAQENLSIENFRLYVPVYDLKFALLLKMQKYEEAQKFLDAIKKRVSAEDADRMSVVNRTLLKKKLSVKEKIAALNIKVI